MSTHPAVKNGAYDVARVRQDFPALAMQVYGKPLVYLDNAASAQKPSAVLDRMTQAYQSEYANVHRGLHYLANAATEAYEGGRTKAAQFINAARTEEVIFTRNATEAINLVASSWGGPNIKEGDEIVISIMEHHSNIVPWHFLRERQGAVIKWAPVDDEGNFLIDEFEKLLTSKTKLVAITQMSNALGTIVPVKDVVKIAHARGIPVLVDGSHITGVYGILPSKEAMARAKESAEKALKLDPSLCEPYCTLGYYYTCYERNWPEAKKNFLKSIEINPRFAEGHLRYGWNYLATVEGKFEEAEKHGAMAIRLEPLSSYCHASYSLILHCAGKFKEALAVCKTGIELDANSFLCYATAGCIHMALGQYDEAISCFETSLILSNRHSFTIHGVIWIYCITGQIDKATVLMNDLKEKSKSEYLSNALTALSAACLNNMDEAFDYLEKAFDDRDPSLILLKYKPWVPASLRADPRFQKILERIGFPR